MYHAVGTRVKGDFRGIFSVTPDEFKQQMEYLSQHAFIKMTSLELGLMDPAPCRVSLTFDDGYRDILPVAEKILVPMGIPFVLFITKSYAQRTGPEYLSKDAIREISRLAQVTIGAHGATHKRLTECSDQELVTELKTSREFLEDVISKPVRIMAYPHGAVNERVVQAVVRAGYSIAVSTRAGINNSASHLMKLKRTEISGLDDLADFKMKIFGAWDWYGVKSWVCKT
ncbi:MAG: polysaccharide deacetylase family protein [Deltaproteobacteria bacterium]|nr:polysaccharide deacetylase family protein [Deltaproteobacteria bacterium]